MFKSNQLQELGSDNILNKKKNYVRGKEVPKFFQ